MPGFKFIPTVFIFLIVSNFAFAQEESDAFRACFRENVRTLSVCDGVKTDGWDLAQSVFGIGDSDEEKRQYSRCIQDAEALCAESLSKGPSTRRPGRPLTPPDAVGAGDQGTGVIADDAAPPPAAPPDRRRRAPNNPDSVADAPATAPQGQQQPAQAAQPTQQACDPDQVWYPSKNKCDFTPEALQKAEALYQKNEQGQSVGAIVAEYEKCQAQYNNTEKCCEHPESCIAESLGGKSGDGSAAYKALQMVGTLAGAVPASSIGQACGRMKDVATGFAVLNTALAAKCESKVKTCNDICGEVGRKAKEKLAELEKIETNQYNSGWITDYRSQMRTFAGEKSNCNEFNNAVVEKAAQAVASAYSAKMAGTCKEIATNGAGAIAPNTFDVDCTNVANAANPVCQSACNRQGWENDPVCVAANGGNRNPNLNTGSGGAGDRAPGSPLDGLELSEDPQEVEAMAANPGQPGGTNVGQGGGGFDAGGGGGMGGAGSADAGGGGGGGYNKDIIAGTRTGGGYSIPGGSRGFSGGYSGGSSGGRKVASDGKPFNPRDFLPGGRLDPKRKLAGLSAAAAAGVGAVHGNIFTNISNRFYQVCLRDGLMDCSTLRKRGRVGSN
jgi:hypothetical protein